MFRIAKNVNVSIINSVNWYSRCFSNIPQLHVSEEVRNALESNKPVIALESTIITHGMPFPQNVECAKEVENIVREQVTITITYKNTCAITIMVAKFYNNV